MAWEDRGPAGGKKRKWYDTDTHQWRYQISEPGSRAKARGAAPATPGRAAPATSPAGLQKPPARPQAAPAPKPRAPEPSPYQRLSPQARAQADRIAQASRNDLADRAHPMNRLRGQIADADFGAGRVRTLRSTRDNPLSAKDHELMDRAHSRAAALLRIQGNDAGARAQMSAAAYHRSLAERKKAPAPKLSAAHHEALSRAKQDIARSPFKSEQERRRAEAHVEHIVSRMSEAAIKRLSAGASSSHYYPDSRAMQTGALLEAGEMLPPGAMGAYLIPGKGSAFKPQLHMDGMRGRTDNRGRLFQGRDADTQRGTWAHEMCHAIDGPDFELSTSAEWLEAFNREVRPPIPDDYFTNREAQDRYHDMPLADYPLSKYATQDQQEGFAEFGRLVYGTDADLGEVQKRMPKCYAFFKSRGLLP